MKFQKDVAKELCIMLQHDLQQYTKEVNMTEYEYKEVCKWVQAGNSPYMNAWDIATDAGTPMDYIAAKRVVEDEMSSSEVCAVTKENCNSNENLF